MRNPRKKKALMMMMMSIIQMHAFPVGVENPNAKRQNMRVMVTSEGKGGVRQQRRTQPSIYIKTSTLYKKTKAKAVRLCPMSQKHICRL